MNYVGIDPGRDGALAVIYDTGEIEITCFDVLGYDDALSALPPGETKCCLERVGAMPGQGVASMFRFGENFGIIQGLLIAYGISFQLVTPQRWKRIFGITSDKNRSISVCKRLFPGVYLRRTDRCKKDHDGMAEALLMAEYARRKM